MTSERVSDERLVIEPGYTTSFDTAINCLRDEAKECDRTNRVGRMGMLNAIANELVALQSLRSAREGCRQTANSELLGGISPSTEGSRSTGARVKRLEWSARAKNGDTTAHSVVGEYAVGEVHGYHVAMLRTDGDLDVRVAKVPGFEQAKAAAQADYERRILSALEPVEAEAVAWRVFNPCVQEDDELSWFYFEDQSSAAAEADVHDLKVEPLYASPASATVDGWRPMETAPKDATVVLLRIPATATRQARVMVGHYACDMSGEEQPPFCGWFYDHGNGLMQIRPDPSHWAPLTLTAALSKGGE